ncbi:glutamyl aminopeptidase isoform X1 [Strongylocentrotus purpuratus]|uniref:Aminopeptidase n=1 Tax=Strongylocentrotus purpuratus TaxID=7668 RepID=A0A7M7NFV6_STRPU|nr:glutamyl aminopeptidase isoform X1 [Strongylocentrotus purpuratus]
MDDQEPKGGYYLRKSQLIAGGVLAGCLCLMVGLMCGLLPQSEICEAPPVEGAAAAGPASDTGVAGDTPKDDVGPGVTVDPEWFELRLPTTVKPTHYHLLLHPNLTTNYFTGEVQIEITVTAAVMYPRLHIKAMDIMDGSVSITDMDNNDQQIKDIFQYVPNEFLVMEMVNGLQPGDYMLNIGFGGWLNETIVGFYKSVYQDANGNDKAIATSKFQPTDARRAFPCFDEPAFKANYTTSLVHPADYIALSNMDVRMNETYEDGLMITHFNPSVPMSTYLACFIVCQFDYREMFTMSDIPFRVYAPVDVIDQVEYSLKIGVNITDYYEEYFDLGYPLPKLDMIAIPDFVSGAMEHWGLITYREVNLLFDDAGSSESNKERVAAVVAHELAHMWFGNIVTCDWWDDLWLNEGFASYLEYLGVNSVEPDWKMLEVFVSSDLHYVMGLDQIVSSHPIIVEVNHPDEINEIFDSIPYSKGASVIRMLDNFLGEDVFRAGVSEFLKFYQYGTAVTDDLWEKLTEAAAAQGRDVNVKRVMDTWTLQMGFPVVTMEKVNEGGVDYLKGTQDWFLVDPNANKSADQYGTPFGDYEWEIPFHYRFKSQENENREWMWRNESEFMTPWVGNDDFYVANSDRMGYYRINYDEETWEALGQQLQDNYTEIGEGERAGIIDDSFNLARASRVHYSVALNMTKYLTSETEFVPWDTARDNLLWLGEIMRFQPGYGLYRTYIRDLTNAKYNELGWRDDGSHLDKFIRSDIIDLACRHGNSMCLEEAVNLFYDFLNGTTVSPNLASDMYQFGMQEVGGQEEWKRLFENYQSTDVSQERTRLLYGMAQTRIPWILANYLDMLLMDDSPIRSQDFFSVVGYVGDNPVGNPIAWDWTRVRWTEIVDKFGTGNRYLGRMIPGLTEFYSTELGLQEMMDFFEEYPDAGAGSRARLQAIETVQGNINWVERNADIVYEWLQENRIAS